MNAKKIRRMFMAVGLTLCFVTGCTSGSGNAGVSGEAASGDSAEAALENREAVDGTSGAEALESDASAKAHEGAILNIYSRTDEFRHRVQDYFPGYEYVDDNTGKIGDIEVRWTMIADESEYLGLLDTILPMTADGSASEGEAVDLFLVEEDYAKKYVESAYALDVEKEIGLTSEELADQYAYTKEIGSDQEGNLKAVSWQATPGLFAYRRSIAMDVLGTDDPEEVGKAISDWTEFENVAAQAKRKKYFMLSGYNDAFRVFADNVSSPWVTEEGVSVDAHLEEWADMMISFTRGMYHNKTTLWSDEWYADQTADGKVFGFFYPTWGIHYTLQETAIDVDAESEEKSDQNQQNENAVSADVSAVTEEKTDPIIGDYAVCEAPEAYHWGGIWLMGARGTDNPTLVKELMETFTCNRDVMMSITKDIKEFTNTRSGMKELAEDDETFAQDFLGGQNPMPYFVRAAQKVSQKYVTSYDADLNEGYQVAMDDVMEGKSTKEAAMDYFRTVAEKRYPELDPEAEQEQEE